MPISVHCPKCNTPFRLPDAMAGKKVKCQNCQSAIDVPGEKPKTPRDTAFAATDGKKATKIVKSVDPDVKPKSVKKPTRPAPKAKSGGGLILLLLFGFLGLGLFGCIGCGIAGFYWMGDWGAGKPGLIAFNDKKDGPKDKIDVVKNDFGKDGLKKDDKKDDGKKDGPPPGDGIKKDDTKKDGPPPGDGIKKDDTKKDGPPPGDGIKKDDAKKDGPPPGDGIKKDDAKKDGPPPGDGIKKDDAKKDGPPKDGVVDPFKDKKQIVVPPPPGARPVIFDAVGVYNGNDVIRKTDRIGRSGNEHKAYVANLDADISYEIDLRRLNSRSMGLVVIDDRGKTVAQTDPRIQSDKAVMLFRPARSGVYVIEASDFPAASKLKSAMYTFTMRRCDNMPVGVGMRVGIHQFKFEPEGTLAPDLVWASDAKSFYVITDEGTLRQVEIGSGATKQENNLRSRCTGMSMSAEGLVLAMVQVKELWIVDPTDLKVKTKMPLPGIFRLATGSEASVAAVCVRGLGGVKDGLSLVDLKKGSVIHHIKAPEHYFLRSTRDGKFFFGSNLNQPVHRYRCDGATLALEETGNEPGDVGRELRISPDDQFVWLQLNRGKADKGAGIHHVTDLKKTVFTIPSDSPVAPSIGAVDPRCGYFYGSTDTSHLVIYTPNGTKKAELTIPAFDFHPADEISVSPLGSELLIRGNSSIAYVKVHTPGEQMARIEPKIKPKDPIDPKDPKDPKEKDPKDPIKPKEPVKVRPLEKDDFSHRVLTMKGNDIPARSPVWTTDGKAYIVLWQNGILQRINAESGAVDKEHQLATLAGADANLGMSAEGLVVSLPRDKQVVVVDPDDITMVKKRIGVAGVTRLATAPESKQAVVAISGAKGSLRVLDLAAGEAGPGLPFKTATLLMKMSPDGKSLYFSDNGKLFRYRFDGINVTFEENTPYQVAITPISVHVSNDSQYVSLVGKIAAPPPDHPGRELFVFSADALKKPTIALPKLDYPRALGVDNVANWIYTNDDKRSLIIYNMAGIKQGEFPIPGVDAEKSFEFLVSPLGQAFLIRTNSSVVHVGVKISGAPSTIVKDDPKLPMVGKNLVSIVTKSGKIGALRMDDLSIVSRNVFSPRPTLPIWDAKGQNLYWLNEDNLYKLTRDMKIEASTVLPQRCQYLALTKEGIVTSSTLGNELWVLDPSTMAITSKTPGGPGGYVVGSSTSPHAVVQFGEINLLDAKTGKLTKATINNAPVGLEPVRTLAMSHDGKYLIVQGGDTSLHRFRVNGAQLVLEASKAGSPGGQIHISPDSRYVTFFSAGGGGPIKKGFPPTGTEIFLMDNWKAPAYVMPERLRLAAFDSSGRLWATVNSDRLRLYPNPVKTPLLFQEIPLPTPAMRLITGPGTNGCLVITQTGSSHWIQ